MLKKKRKHFYNGKAIIKHEICTEETMYRFATEGETKKRTLNTGDITGIKKLYG